MCNSCGSGIHFLGDHVMKKLNFSSLKSPNQEHDQLQPPPKDESKDAETTIFSGGSILTMENGAFSPKGALVMKGETIQFTGSLEDALKGYGEGAIRYDLAGKCLLPGFIDPHVHITLTSLANNYFLDLSATKVSKLQDAVKILTDALIRGILQNGWIVGFGYDPSRVADNPHLTKHILGEISEDVPIFVLNQSGHIAYVNSKALKEAGMNESTAPSRFQRDPKNPKNGLTGVIFEEEAISEVALIIPPPAEDLVQQWVENIFKNCASRGCTTIYEVQLGAFGLGEIDLIKEASQGPNVPVNLYGAYSEKILAAKPQLKPETLGGIHMQGIKFVTDGSTQGYSAAVTESYLHSPAGTEKHGILNYKITEILIGGMRSSVEAGFQIVVHANGDAAIDQALVACNAIKGHGSYPGLHRIDHFTVNRPDQLQSVKELGLSLSHTINHVRWWGQVFVEDIIGLSRARRIAPLKSDFDLDITVSMHSDSPVTEVYPLSYLRTAVTRFMGDAHTPLGEEEIIPLEKALTCITLSPAKQLGIDHITGTLGVGKNADMVMLDSDPQNIPPSLLDSLKVEATWVKGKQAYRA